MAGKDKLLRWARLYRGAFDLSGQTREIGDMANAVDFANFHSIADAVKWGTAQGHRNIGITGYQALMDDTAVTGSHTLLKAPDDSTQVTVLFGGSAVPAVGDPAYIMGGALQIADNPRTFTENVALLQADFISDGAQELTGNPLGRALSINTSIAITTTGTSFNSYEDASSANGGYATLHILATSSGNYTLKIQDSPDNSAWADLITFTSIGGSLESELATVSGTVDKWLRFQATKTAGTITAICAFARN